MNEKKTVQAHRCKDDIKMQIMCVWCDDVPCMGPTASSRVLFRTAVTLAD